MFLSDLFVRAPGRQRRSRGRERHRTQHPHHGNHEAQSGQRPQYQLDCFPCPHCTPPSPLPLHSKFGEQRSQIGTLLVHAVKLSHVARFCNLSVDFCKQVFTTTVPLYVYRFSSRAERVLDAFETITIRCAAMAIGKLQKHKAPATRRSGLGGRSWVHLFTGGPRGSCGSV